MKSRTSKKPKEGWRAALRLFSGRRNPEWELSEACREAIREKIASNKGQQAARPVVKLPQSGYRGIRVSITGGYKEPRQVDLFQSMLVDSMAGCLCHDADDLARQAYDCMPESELKKVDGASYDALQVADNGLSFIEGITSVPTGLACKGAPEYLGDEGLFKEYRRQNNCYNYGIDKHVTSKRDTAMPGGFDEISSPEKFRAAFHKDHLAFLGTKLKHECPAEDSHYIAVVLRDEASGTLGDFHVLRLDSNGLWSHKDNDDPVTPYDGNGQLISDLRAAQFQWPSRLLGFYRVPHNIVVVGGQLA